MSTLQRILTILVMTLVLLLPPHARAQDITGLIKIFGLGYVVNQYAEPLNDFVNGVLANQGVKVLEQTKVVPVLSIGGPGQLHRRRAGLRDQSCLAKVEAAGQWRRTLTSSSASKLWSRSTAATQSLTGSGLG